MLKEVVQKFEQTLSLRPVTDGVKATIWTEFLKETGVWIPYWRKVELHGPSLLIVPTAQMLHDKSGKSIRLALCGRTAFTSASENSRRFVLAAWLGGAVGHPVIREAASGKVEVIVADT